MSYYIGEGRLGDGNPVKLSSKITAEIQGPDDSSFESPMSPISDHPFFLSLIDYDFSSYNGIVCLFYSHDAVVLWNPYIRKILNIPFPDGIKNYQGKRRDYSLGFGFGSCAHDYKLVRVMCHEDGPFVEVYSLNKKCWSIVNNDIRICQSFESRRSVFLNGACHWVAGTLPMNHRHYSNNMLSCYVIVLFDLKDESFTEMAGPKGVNSDESGSSVSVLDGMLTLVLIDKCFIEMDNYTREFSVWVMKEYGVVESWTRLYKVENLEECAVSIVAVRNSAVLLAMPDHKLVCYNPVTRKMTDFLRGFPYSFALVTCVESLFWFEEANEASSSSDRRIDLIQPRT
ncbi:F-box/kelch-repeat protein At3g06240-like [Mercurialis annua]|uniref:F-box/kelch-repeat protein At3g06240-like n=1 Tax=Mercurialis annua TaxID=3986 RepID=UPI00215F8015|nr:F-box/kelch-repeat protein At3g06240-like [Mercurialis annua]